MHTSQTNLLSSQTFEALEESLMAAFQAPEAYPFLFNIWGEEQESHTAIITALNDSLDQAVRIVQARLSPDLELNASTQFPLLPLMEQINCQLPRPFLFYRNPFHSLHKQYDKIMSQLECNFLATNALANAQQLMAIKALVNPVANERVSGYLSANASWPTVAQARDLLLETDDVSVDEVDQKISFLRQYLIEGWQERLYGLLLSPLVSLSRAFIKDLVKKARKQPILLLFNFSGFGLPERAIAQLNCWLRYYLWAGLQADGCPIRLMIMSDRPLLSMPYWQSLRTDSARPTSHIPNLMEWSTTQFFDRPVASETEHDPSVPSQHPQAFGESALQQQLLAANPGDTIALWPLNQEIEGPLIINSPVHLDAKGATLWAKKGPVLSILSNQVTLCNLRVEVTGNAQERSPTPLERCAIMSESTQDINLSNIRVRGNTMGLAADEGTWLYPNELHLGSLTCDRSYEFELRVVVPVSCRVASQVAGITVQPEHLQPGRNTVLIRIESTIRDTLLMGEIRLIGELDSIVRGISTDAYVRAPQPGNRDPDSKVVIWQPAGWVTATNEEHIELYPETERPVIKEVLDSIPNLSQASRPNVDLPIAESTSTHKTDTEPAHWPLVTPQLIRNQKPQGDTWSLTQPEEDRSDATTSAPGGSSSPSKVPSLFLDSDNPEVFAQNPPSDKDSSAFSPFDEVSSPQQPPAERHQPDATMPVPGIFTHEVSSAAENQEETPGVSDERQAQDDDTERSAEETDFSEQKSSFTFDQSAFTE